MAERAYIRLSTKLAAALCLILRIPHDHAIAMEEEQILSLVHWDHYPVRKADGGPDTHFNLVPRPILAHREKTATIDAPQMAKSKRVRAREAAHRAAMLVKIGQAEAVTEFRGRPKKKIQSRGFEKVKRPMRSRSTWR